jgi:hypothetical protein
MGEEKSPGVVTRASLMSLLVDTDGAQRNGPVVGESVSQNSCSERASVIQVDQSQCQRLPTY